MVFELLMFAVLAITFFLSVIVVNTGAEDLNNMEAHKYMMSILQWWILGNGSAFLVYLIFSAFH